VITGWGRGMTRGARLSVSGGEGMRTGSALSPGGPWIISAAGPKGTPRPSFTPFFLFCNFPFSVFLISLITFDFDIQMISTQLLKFSKTQNIIAKQ
jgi:hypothetical protein